MILITLLAVYYITTILNQADGPWGVIYHLRNIISPFKCFVCTAPYVSAIVALYPAQNAMQWIVWTTGLAGGAVAIDRLTTRV